MYASKIIRTLGIKQLSHSTSSCCSPAAYPQNLGLLVFILRQATDRFIATLDAQKSNENRLEHVADLGSEQLKEVSDR